MNATDRDYHYANGSAAHCEDKRQCGFNNHHTLAEAMRCLKLDPVQVAGGRS